jgi:hypothetical protein
MVPDPIERKIMAELVEEKMEKIVPKDGQWRVLYMAFSRNRWTSGALADQNEINRQARSGKNLRLTRMMLMDLQVVNEVL